MQRAHDPQRVRRAVEEIRIAEGNMLRAARDLLADVGEHDRGGDRAEMPLVHRHHRAMTAPVLAAAARLREGDGLFRAVRKHQPRVAFERRQAGTLGHHEIDLAAIHDRRCRGNSRAAIARIARGGEQLRLEFAADHLAGAACLKQRGVHRRVKPVCAQARARRERPDARKRFERDARRGVHAKVYRDQGRIAPGDAVELLQRQVDAGDAETFAREQRRGLRQRERLAAELVGTDQDDFARRRSHFVLGRASKPGCASRLAPASSSRFR